MRKVLLLLIACGILFAASESEEFFYQRGLEAGYQKGFEVGVEKGLAEAKEVIRKYKEEIAAYEIGKYLIKSQKLTYPQIWQQKDKNGIVKLVVLPSEIVDTLDIDGLFTKFATIPTLNSNDLDISDLSNTNSVYLAQRDMAIDGIPSTSNRDKDIISIKVEKSWKNENILKKANLVYSENDDSYRVIFFSNQEKKDFCNNFGICK